LLEWNLKPLKWPKISDDLIYPSWFLAKLDIANCIVSEEREDSIKHFAKFIGDSFNRRTADRDYNKNSYAFNTKEKEFLFIKNDPSSDNLQFEK
tara:strand:- start:228 stop:509 length:282 start_codon:yes stop_codon:yes gene_type:complete